MDKCGGFIIRIFIFYIINYFQVSPTIRKYTKAMGMLAKSISILMAK
jgi:hypothetical protein